MNSVKKLWSPKLKRRALDLGLYGHSDYTRFIILGRSRVGSNLLRGLLNSHSQIVAYGEVFRDGNSMDWDHTGYYASDGMRELVQNDAVRFLKKNLFGRYPKSIRTVGFKLFYYHARKANQSAVWSYLQQDRELKIIHLKRKHLLQTHVSRKRAAMTDRWVNTSGEPDEDVSIRLDYQECLDDFVQTRAWEAENDSFFAGHSVLEVQYEKLAGDYRGEAKIIQEFLGVNPEPVRPKTFQQARQPLSRTIENYAELKERFGGTAWAEFFAD